MKTTLSGKQRGFSFGGFIMAVVLLVVFAIFGFKLIPAYMEDGKIENTFIEMARAPDLQNASPAEIMKSFVARAAIDDITAIKADDIDISTDDGKLVLSASYEVKVPVGGNVSLLLTFNPSSAGN